MRSRPFTIVHTECSLGWGGQEIRVFTEMQAMRERGHRLSLCAPKTSAIFQRCKDAGFTVHSFNDHKLAFPLTIARLSNFFRKEKVDVVNTHSSRDGWLGGIAARLAGVPLLIRSRHIEVDYPNRFLSRIAFHYLPHHVVTTSRKIADRLIQELDLAPERVTCLPTGVDLKKFSPAVAGHLHEELGLAPNIQLVGMISVLRSWKGHAYFLGAASELLRVKRDVHFVIAGDGPGREGLQQKIKAGLQDHVTWLGHREDVPNILASLNVLVLPSTAHEGIPQIILQAQAMAKAVVGTSVGGIPEVVCDGETGLLAPSREIKPLAAKILRLLENDGLRTRLGQQAREQVVKENSLDAMCEGLEQIYKRYFSSSG